VGETGRKKAEFLGAELSVPALQHLLANALPRHQPSAGLRHRQRNNPHAPHQGSVPSASALALAQSVKRSPQPAARLVGEFTLGFLAGLIQGIETRVHVIESFVDVRVAACTRGALSDPRSKQLDLVYLRSKWSESTLALNERQSACYDEMLSDGNRLKTQLTQRTLELLSGGVFLPGLVDCIGS
jgi:hypothetical protein